MRQSVQLLVSHTAVVLPSLAKPFARSGSRHAGDSWVARLAAAAVLSCAVGCGASAAQLEAARPKCPGWTHGATEDRRYPTSKFIIGLGTSEQVWDRQGAEREASSRAMGEIATQVRANVHSNTSITGSESSSNSGGTSTNIDIKSNTDVESNAMLEGVDIADRCMDTSEGRMYVLAVLDRGRFLTRAKAEATRLDGEATAAFTRASAERDAVAAVRELRQALGSAQLADGYFSAASTIGGATIKPVTSMQAVADRLTDLSVSRLGVVLALSDQTGTLSAAVEKAIAAERLTVVPSGHPKAALELAMKVSYTTRIGTMGLYMAVATADLTLRRTPNGSIDGRRHLEETAGGQTAEMAISRAASSFAPKLEKETRAVFHELFQPAQASGAQ